jgi:ABC-2 type transport system ATP-binding protein
MTLTNTGSGGADLLTQKSLAADMVDIRGLTRGFGEVTAVAGVDLGIRKGEIFGLLGPNGAGKSTLIKLLTTLLPPSSGTATVAGFDIRRDPARVREVIAYVPQLVSADGGLTAEENLRLFARLHGIPRKEIGPRIQEALSFVGLLEAAKRAARTYSGGMVRRLEIAIALIHRPKILFLDEPTVGLDPIARQLVWKQVQRLVRELGATILLTTHFMEEADALCDRIAIMNRGKVSAVGTSAELKAGTGISGATLDDVFAAHSLAEAESSGGLREVAKSRRSLARLG